MSLVGSTPVGKLVTSVALLAASSALVGRDLAWLSVPSGTTLLALWLP